MSVCYHDGDLRAYIDGEIADGERAAVSAHLSGCYRCRQHLAELQEIARQVSEACRLLEPLATVDVRSTQEAYRRVQARVAVRETGWRTSIRRFREMIGSLTRTRIAATAAAVAVVVVLASVIAIPPVRLAAAQLLGIMKVQKFVAVTIDPATLPRTTIDLSQLGDIGPVQMPKINPAGSVAEVEAKVGFKPSLPTTLPQGVPSEPEMRTTDAGSFAYTFNVKKAEEYLKRIGETDFSVPAKFDGAKLTADIPSFGIFAYGFSLDKMQTAHDTEPVGIAVVEGKSPTLTVEGQVSLEELRDLLLSIPGLPASTIEQIKAIGDWKNTLPVPVPKDYVSSESVSVNGADGLLVMHKEGKAGVVMWQKGGVVYAVAGTVTKDQVLATARSLKP